MTEAEQLDYWRSGNEIVQACLEKAAKGRHEDAPFPLDAQQAALYHAAQVDAYRHALEMMGVPECLRVMA